MGFGLVHEVLAARHLGTRATVSHRPARMSTSPRVGRGSDGARPRRVRRRPRAPFTPPNHIGIRHNSTAHANTPAAHTNALIALENSGDELSGQSTRRRNRSAPCVAQDTAPYVFSRFRFRQILPGRSRYARKRGAGDRPRSRSPAGSMVDVRWRCRRQVARVDQAVSLPRGSPVSLHRPGDVAPVEWEYSR